jgi:hypothetical protein
MWHRRPINLNDGRVQRPARRKVRHGAEKVATRRWKLASYEVAGNLSGCLFVLKGRWLPPSRQDGFRMGKAPDTLCLANFRLSLRDEGAGEWRGNESRR